MPISTFLHNRPATQLRGLGWLALSETGVRSALSGTSDGGGGFVSAWTAAGTTACRIDPMSPRTITLGGRIDENATHTVTVPSNFPMQTTDRFTIANRGTFEVLGLYQQTDAPFRTFEVVTTS